MKVEIKGAKLEDVSAKDLSKMVGLLHDSLISYFESVLTGDEFEGFKITVREIKNSEKGFTIELTGNK